MTTIELLQRNAMQISYVNSIEHSGVVRAYLKEARANRLLKEARMKEANKIIDDWMSRWFNNPTNSVLVEAQKYKARINEVSLEELGDFIYTFRNSGFNRAISKLYEL